jgi:hypothetical protein
MSSSRPEAEFCADSDALTHEQNVTGERSALLTEREKSAA